MALCSLCEPQGRPAALNGGVTRRLSSGLQTVGAPELSGKLKWAVITIRRRHTTTSCCVSCQQKTRKTRWSPDSSRPEGALCAVLCCQVTRGNCITCWPHRGTSTPADCCAWLTGVVVSIIISSSWWISSLIQIITGALRFREQPEQIVQPVLNTTGQKAFWSFLLKIELLNYYYFHHNWTNVLQQSLHALNLEWKQRFVMYKTHWV